MKTKVRLKYNAPFVLTFSIACVLVQLIQLIPGLSGLSVLFTVSRHTVIPGIITHVLGHSGFEHLIGNLSFILLLGPMLEEKYGTKLLGLMVLLTAFVTGLVNLVFFPFTALCGASGIVFMFIVLCSFTHEKAVSSESSVSGRVISVPLTLILVSLIYVGKEVLGVFQSDNISQMAHILGGFCGAVFGGIVSGRRNH